MLSLVYACAQKVVSDHASLRRALGSIPRELYPPLFTAAFLGRKTLVLQDLVQRWPFPVLSFQELLRVHPGQIHLYSSWESTQTVILGIVAYLGDAMSRDNGASKERGIQEPLESLELAFCFLLPPDLYYLTQSLHVSALKKVDVSGTNLSELLLPPLLQLLAAVSSSLLHLDVMECRLTDSALSALAPALCRCSRLRYLGLFSNPLSSQGLRTLLQDCLGLRELRLVVYPYPVDCCGEGLDWADFYGAPTDGFIDQRKLALFSAELQEALARVERTDLVWTTDLCLHRNLDYLNL